jgi:O-antigen/teichoic acid export membrane protein
MRPSLALNTLSVYAKTVITLFTGLFSTRIVLRSLGVEDFGIYALVASVIGWLGFLNEIMASATRRFLAYHRTKSDLPSVFSASVVIHFCTGALFVVGIEILGFLFLPTLNIPPDRLGAAWFVFHCMVASFFFGFISNPYSSQIVAQEQIVFWSINASVMALLKLGAVFFLAYTSSDKLKIYGFLMALVLFLEFFNYRIFCAIKYKTTKFSFKLLERNVIFEMLKFSAWKWLETIATVSYMQGIPLILNLFFGTRVNAAYGITNQVLGAMQQFAYSLSLSIVPRIQSSISENKTEKANLDTISVCKLTGFVFAVFGIPLFLNIHFVIQLWLGDIPEYVPIFCQLALASSWIVSLSNSLHFLVEGKGKIELLSIFSCISYFLAPGISYLLLKYGMSPYFIFVGLIASHLSLAIVRFYFAHRATRLSLRAYAKQIGKVILLVLFSFSCTYAISLLSYPSPWLRLSCTTALSTMLMLGGLWWALDANERCFAKSLTYTLTKKHSNPQGPTP